MNIFLYGAGKRGKKLEELLFSKKIIIKGIADSNKAGEIWNSSGGESIKILSKEELVKFIGNGKLIISINNPVEVSKLKEFFINSNINVITYEDLMREIQSQPSIVEINRNAVADYHINQMEDYYENGEKSLSVFWDKSSPFYKLFSQLDISNIIELACGHGRHVTQYIDLADHITLVDILDKNIQFCKNRFGENDKISYYVNNGFDLSQLKDSSYTALFTYDAMVHFELFDVFNYLKETYRVLKSGGMALFHHSNNTSDYKVTFTTGKNGRNYMSKDIFAYLANRAGLEIVSQELYDWSADNTFSDCITLVKKSNSKKD